MSINSTNYRRKRSLAFIVLITGIVGGLLIVFSILLLCKYCLNRKHLREAEQVKLLYETLNQRALLHSNRLYQCQNRESSRLEPRRSNPIERCPSAEDQQQKSSLKALVAADCHNGIQSLLDNKQDKSNICGNISADDDPAEQYLQVDPRCYVRQKSNVVIVSSRYKKSETPRLEKGHSLNVDTRSSPTPSSPYRQSSFDVTLAYHSQNQQHQLTSMASSTVSSQREVYYTPIGSSLSVRGNTPTSTPPGSQHLSPPTSITPIRQNSIGEKKDVTVQLNVSGRTSSIIEREHEHSRSLEQSSSTSHNPIIDKQFRSFDAVQLLRPVIHREDAVVNRRTKSYEYAEEHQPVSSSVAPPPIVIKIPDMKQLVQAAQLSQLKNIHFNQSRRNSNLPHQIIINNSNTISLTSQEFWGLRQSYRYNQEQQQQQQQQLDRTSPEDFSPDLLTSTSIDSAGAMSIHQSSKKTTTNGLDDDPSKYEYRRKSSSNLLLPPPEVRRQALRRTFEKRRSIINQSNAKREQQQMNNQYDMDQDFQNSNQSSTLKSTEFSSLLNNFNSKSENSSFDRSLETDFDLQSDTSSRGPTDHFTSIESSGNENVLPDLNHRLLITQKQQSPAHQDDSGYKSLESQHSQNRTISLDWFSHDGDQANGDPKDQQQSVNNNNNNSPKLSQEPSPVNVEQRNLSQKPNPFINKLVSSPSFNRTASKKRREFSKDKRHAASNVGIQTVITTTDEHQKNNEENPKQKSTLRVRHFDLRRSKSDQSEIIDSSDSNQSNKNPPNLSSSEDAILHSTPLPTNPIESRQIFQRSPSTATSALSVSPQIVAFRSKRGSISFDQKTPIINQNKTSTADSLLSKNISKPRLKFSMLRDTTAPNLNNNYKSNNSMSLANDLTIDEKTNRIINEFLMQDNHRPNQQNIGYKETKTSPSVYQQFEKSLRRDDGISLASPSIIVTGYDSSS